MGINILFSDIKKIRFSGHWEKQRTELNTHAWGTQPSSPNNALLAGYLSDIVNLNILTSILDTKNLSQDTYLQQKGNT